ncbi:MAG: MerR family transcriptional regulator [Fimbriimonadaceae bacterium]|nr:MerR family transcriptional regulator [Fimbriimonadaceae bacterium]
MKPELLPYANMPPCTAKELIGHANKVLRAMGLPDVQIRTLRFYIAQGVVPPPVGSPKFARYDFQHLRGIVSSRALQNEGLTLTQIRGQGHEANIVREHKAAYGAPPTVIQLTPRCRLELPDGKSLDIDLRAAQAALARMIGRGVSKQ